MARAFPRRLLVIDEPARARPRGKADRGLEERAFDELPFARALSLVERGEDALHAPHAGPEVADGQADRGRRAVGLSRDVHDAAHALGDQVEAAPLPVRSVRAEAGELGVDEARIRLLQDLVAEPRALHDGRTVVLHEHVRARHELE